MRLGSGERSHQKNNLQVISYIIKQAHTQPGWEQISSYYSYGDKEIVGGLMEILFILG